MEIQVLWLTLPYFPKVGAYLGSNSAGIHNRECNKEKCLVYGGCDHNKWLYSSPGSGRWTYDSTIRLTCKGRYFAHFNLLCIHALKLSDVLLKLNNDVLYITFISPAFKEVPVGESAIVIENLSGPLVIQRGGNMANIFRTTHSKLTNGSFNKWACC